MGVRFTKILTWAGLIAVLSLPILLLAKKGRPQERREIQEDENNIFGEELAERVPERAQ